jgi:hypothetical protein
MPIIMRGLLFDKYVIGSKRSGTCEHIFSIVRYTMC